MWYRAELENDNFEMILADNDNEAYEKAIALAEEMGDTLFNLFLLDDNDEIVRTVF